VLEQHRIEWNGKIVVNTKYLMTHKEYVVAYFKYYSNNRPEKRVRVTVIPMSVGAVVA
jgi:hypothetical protein